MVLSEQALGICRILSPPLPSTHESKSHGNAMETPSPGSTSVQCAGLVCSRLEVPLPFGRPHISHVSLRTSLCGLRAP